MSMAIDETLAQAAPARPRLHVVLTDRRQDFLAMREQWEAIYDADPDSHFFLSWTFMAELLEEKPKGDSEPWCIVAVKPSAEAREFLAILPLRMHKAKPGTDETPNRLIMGGRRYADYTGVLCRPEAERLALPALGTVVKRLPWDQWELEYFRASDERLGLLLSSFATAPFNVTERKAASDSKDIDYYVCPSVELPDNWDDFLLRLSVNSRQKFRRLLRTVDDGEEFHISHATAETIERDIKILLHFWKLRWQEEKGDRLQTILQVCATMLHRNFRNGTVVLSVMWRGTRPLGAHAVFIDDRKRTMLFSIGSRDERYDQPSPGLTLHAHSIRQAIAMGLGTYDFMRGNDAYKYSFGAQDRRIRSIVVTRPA